MSKRAMLPAFVAALIVSASLPSSVAAAVVCFSTYLGGSLEENLRSSAVGPDDSLYVAGKTLSVDLPTRAPYQASNAGGSDLFVAKLDRSGTPIFATYVGGMADDEANGIVLTPAGDVVLVGVTGSADFPLMRPLPSVNDPGAGFVLALDASGSSLVFSTYLGGGREDSANAVAVDASGNVYVTGSTNSDDFPVTAGAFQTTHAPSAPGYPTGNSDAFVTKILADWSAYGYSTFLGGSWADSGYAIDVDATGATVVAGTTLSTSSFPVRRPLAAASGGGGGTFVSRLTPDGSALEFSTRFGGSGNDIAVAVLVETDGTLDVAGSAYSSDFPVVNAVQPNYGGPPNDAFVARIDPAAPALLFSTFLGGTMSDGALSLAYGPDGTLYVSGQTGSPDFPVVRPLQAVLAGDRDAFLALLSRDGSRLLSSTFLGGSVYDSSRSVRLAPSGAIYISGETLSTDFPIVTASQPAYGGGGDAFITRIDCWIAADAGADVTVCPDTPVTLDASQSVGCPSGPMYRWLEGTTVRCTGPTCTVTPGADTTYTLEMTCPSCVTCLDTTTVSVRLLADTIPPDQGNALRAVRLADDVVLTFPGAMAPSWRLYKDADKGALGATALVPDSATTTYRDGGAVTMAPAAAFYRLKGLSPCSSTPGQ